MIDSTTPGSDRGLDPREAADILGAGGRIGSRLAPDSRVLYGVWGLAWLVGYGALWLTARTGTQPAVWAFGLGLLLLIAALVVTLVHITRRSRGLRGFSSTTGVMFGWSWAIAFTVVGLILGAVGESGADPDVRGLISTALPSLVVGVLYMAGAATYREWLWFALGAWIAAMAGIGAMAGLPSIYLVMSVAGGGGLLVGALADHLVRWRRGSTA